MEQAHDANRIAWGKVIAQSWSDEGYKARLLDDPRAVLAEAGLNMPGDVEITVTEQKPGHMHLVLPPNPEDEGMLDEEALEAVSGGWCAGSYGCYACCGS